MPTNHQMTQKKRARERAQQERREVKADKKTGRDAEKAARQALKDQGIDPDLEGIVPGPQPPQE
jgi:3-oxoacyl-[acyl-carrier-protein] synthase III